MSDYNVTVDISDAIEKFATLNNLTKAQAQGLLGLQTRVETFNKAGKRTSEVLEQTISANQKLVVTMANTKEGWTEIEKRVVSTSAAIKRYNDQIQAASSEKNVNAIRNLIAKDIGRGLQFDPKALQQIEKIKTAIARLDTEEVNPKKLKEFFDDIKKGVPVEATTANLAKLRDALVKLQNIRQQTKDGLIGSERSADAVQNANGRRQQFVLASKTNIFDTLGQQFKVNDSDLTTQELKRRRNAVEKIAKEIFDSKNLKLGDVESVFNKLISGNLNRAAIVDPALKNIADQLTTILGLYEKVDSKRRQSAQISLNALNQKSQTQVEQDRNERRIALTQERLNRVISGENKGADFSQTPKIQTLLRQISELGIKAQLTGRQVGELFSRFQEGTLTVDDRKFGRFFDKFEQVNKNVDRAKIRANETLGTNSPFINDILPKSRGNLPPSDEDHSRLKGYNDTLKKTAQVLQYFVAYKGFTFISNQLAQATKDANEFQIQISLIRTISQDSQLSFGQWSQEIRKVSDALGIDFKDTGKAFYDTVSNQIARGKDVSKFVAEAGQLGRTTNSTLTDSVNLLSSAINTYGFDISESEQVSAKFFKTIDLGRIVASDLSNTFGRVGFVARDLGVGFDELLAILSTLTRKGVTTDDALTLITNGMNKLTKPTDSTKELLQTWGFATGEAAVKSLGFVEVLTKMIQASEDGKIAISDLFNEIRGEKFISGVKNSLGEVNSDLRKIRDDSLETFRKAKDIRGESDADQINKQLNKLRNSLIEDFGSKILEVTKSILDFTGGVDGARKSVKGLTDVAIGAVVGYVAYKAAVISLTLAQEIEIVTSAKNISLSRIRNALRLTEVVTTNAATGATTANTTAMAASATVFRAHPIGLFVAAIAGLTAYWVSSTNAVQTYNEKLNGLDDVFKRFQEKQKTTNENNFFKGAGESEEKTKKALQGLITLSSRAVQDATKNLNEIKNRANRTSEDLKNGFGSYTDKIKLGIEEVSKEFHQIDEKVKQSTRSIGSFCEELEGIQFGLKKRFANDAQILPLLDEQIKNLTEKAKTLFGEGTDESVAEARKLFSEIAKIQEEKFNTTIDQRKKSLQEYYAEEARLGRQVPQQDTVFADLSKQSEFIKEQNKLKELRNELEKQYQKSLVKTKELDEKKLIDSKGRLREFQAAVDDLDKLKIFTEDGSISPKFKNKLTGKVDTGKVKEEFGNIRERLFKFGDDSALSVLGIDDLINKRVKAIEDEISATEKKDSAEKKQKQITDAVDKNKQAFDEAKKAIREYGSAVATSSGDIDKLLENLKTLANSDLQKEVTKKLVGNNAFKSKDQIKADFALRDSINKNIADAEAKIPELQARAAAITDKVNKGQFDKINPEEVKNLQRDINLVTQAIQGGLNAAFGDQAGGTVNKKVQGAKPFRESLDILDKLNEEFDKNTKKFNESLDVLDRQKATAAEIAKLSEDAVNNIGSIEAAAAVAGTGITNAFDSVAASVDKLNQKLDDAYNKIKKLQDRENFVGPEPERRAYGGPIGSDNRSIYAKDGEYIMNARASSDFYSQITNMNAAGRTPQYFSTGGSVSMGNMTVNVNESQRPDMTGREVANHIRRQVRLGNIR